MAQKQSPQQRLQDQKDRLGVSAQYDIDNPDLEPERQDQLDNNRIPGQAEEKAVDGTPGLGGRGGPGTRGGQR